MSSENPPDNIREHTDDVILSHRVAVHLWGGIGNQLYLISTLLGYCHKYNLSPVYVKSESSLIRDGENLIEKFPQIQERISEGTLDDFITYQEVIGDDIPFYPCRDVLIKGYFQQEKYFLDIKDDIIELFRSCLVSGPIYDDTVGIHIRRGDFLSFPHIFHSYEADYYKYVLKFFPTSKILAVSTDTDYINENFSEYEKLQLQSSDSFEDFSSLARCSDGTIIGNSTFGWWASYLNTSPNRKIFYPVEWIKDAEPRDYSVYQVVSGNILPHPNWIQLDYFKDDKLTLDVKIALKYIRDNIDPNMVRELFRGKSETHRRELINYYVDHAIETKSHLAEVLELQQKYTLFVTPERRQKLIDNFGDAAVIDIDFTKITLLVISRPERRPAMQKEFGRYGLTPIWIDPVFYINKDIGCGLAHYNAVKYGLKLGGPFCVFEDDINFTDNFKTLIKLPVTCDGFFLGLSSWGLNGMYNDVRHGCVRAQRDVMGYIRLHNMLSAHGILYLNPKWACKMKSIYKCCMYYMLPQDIGSAGLQLYSNTLAPLDCMIYQNIELGGHEETTNIDLRRCLVD